MRKVLLVFVTLSLGQLAVCSRPPEVRAWNLLIECCNAGSELCCDIYERGVGIWW